MVEQAGIQWLAGMSVKVCTVSSRATMSRKGVRSLLLSAAIDCTMSSRATMNMRGFRNLLVFILFCPQLYGAATPKRFKIAF